MESSSSGTGTLFCSPPIELVIRLSKKYPEMMDSRNWFRTLSALIVSIVIIAGFMSFGAEGAALRLQVIDEDRAPLPCRVLIRGPDGKCVTPGKGDVVTLAIGPDLWFMTAGECRVNVPAGECEVRIERGHEFIRFKEQVPIKEPETIKTITLKRWIDMKERGYLCGENHLHVDSKSLGPMLVAEGMDFGTSLTWWNGPDKKRSVPEGSGRSRVLEFAGRKVETSIFDAEIEHSWGAVYIQHIGSKTLPSVADPSRPNFKHLSSAKAIGGITHYQGGWSREVGVDALYGLVDTVNICNNNFHLHKFQPRSRYSNLLKIDGFPKYPDTEAGMLQMNTDTYYRLLNWGNHIAAGAGSATGAKQTPVGYNRAYVRVKKARPKISDFYQAWKEGKNFVTNGPMLFLKTDEGSQPGDVISLLNGGTVHVNVEALSSHPIETVEVIVNGEVVKSVRGEDRTEVKFDADIPLRAGAWIAARCVARDDLLTDDELQRYRKKAHLSEEPSRIRFAHTSPIYVSVRSAGARVQRSIDEGIQMIDAFERFGKDASRSPTIHGFSRTCKGARKTLERRLFQARQIATHPMAAPLVTSLTNPSVRYQVAKAHHVVLKRGDVTAIIVDNAAVDTRYLVGHRAGYNGVASLTHTKRPEKSLFVPQYAGLNFEHIHDGTVDGLVEKFEPRKFPMELRRIDLHTVEVYQPPTGNWKLESCGRYHLLEDGTIEYTFECIPRTVEFRNNYIGLFWASYIDRPEKKSIYFQGRLREGPAENGWVEGVTPNHGIESTHGPFDFPTLPRIDAKFPLTLVNHPSKHVYTEPWFFGVSHGMAFVQMFRKQDRIWLAQSPTGGGETNPAWDFQWFIPDVKKGEAYGMIMRAAYLPYQSNSQVERETKVHRQALNPK